MNENENKGGRFKFRTSHLVYVAIAVGLLNFAFLFYVYHALITPPAPLDKQVEALVKENERLWNMKQAIKQAVK